MLKAAFLPETSFCYSARPALLATIPGMFAQQLTPTTDDWQEQVAHLRAELENLMPQLVDSEAELAERHAAINAFEFRLRARLSPLTRKLSVLDEEIRELRRQLRWFGEGWHAEAANDAAAWARGQSATEEGEYRYRETPTTARPEQDEDTRAEMKKLYRQLARRFHPDTAVDEPDRAYRTQMMMAINAAYAAGDLPKLHELAESPENNHQLDYSQADQKLAETLLREVTRIKRRLAEIKQEVARLEKHESAKMMKKMALAEADGRDYLAELEKQMRDLLAERLAQRDSLQVQVESLEMGEGTDVSDEDFADLVWDVSLETSFEDEISAEFDRYIQRRRDRVYFEDDFDDDYDFE